MTKYMVMRDWLGRYSFIPINRGVADCCGITVMILKESRGDRSTAIQNSRTVSRMHIGI